MATTEPIKGSDQLGRYYTNPLVGSLLVRSMAVRAPTTVLDLGAGNGALVGAALKVWTRANFLTVDIDEQAGCARLPAVHGPSFRHVTADALDPELPYRLGLRPGEACAAVCNPPYIKPRWQAHFGELLEEVGLSGVVPRMSDVPADMLFIAQNLRFLRTGGRLGLILPDGIIAGDRYEMFRQHLLARHRVHAVIELPRMIFRGTEAKAHIVVVSKGPVPTETIAVRKLSNDGRLSPKLVVPQDLAAKRLDFSFLASAIGVPGASSAKRGRRLEQLVESVKRGNYSSSERAASTRPILHTSDLTSEHTTPPSERALKRTETQDMKPPFAEPGDIVIARVGRNHAEKIAIVRQGTYAITDCLFVIRPKPGKASQLLKFFCSEDGKSALEATSHGVGARFISVRALKNLLITTR
ncbi:MAG: hypothetical protein RSP_15570 [Rhodanobacter sp.]